jgi:4'-phosphopantetheinyl transferase
VLNYSKPDYIHCYFDPKDELESPLTGSKQDVFFGVTRDFASEYNSLTRYLNADELSRAERFHYDDDRMTYVTSHALLRLVIFKQLNIRTSDLSYLFSENGKPFLEGNPVWFNLTHTRDAFAFAVSKNAAVGIDMEDINRNIDYESIIKNFFSPEENEFILKNPAEALNRFFLLWTRKEALLKAIGTGLLDNLHKIDVHKSNCFIEKDIFTNKFTSSWYDEYFIFTTRLDKYYLSIAVPEKAEIVFKWMDMNNIPYPD